MDDLQFERINRYLDKLASNAVTQQSKVLFENARTYHQGGQTALVIPILESVSELGDPFYTALSLAILVGLYRRLGNSTKERECILKIAGLPKHSQRFVHPEQLGLVFLRLGDREAAGSHFEKACELEPENPSPRANLSELLLLTGRPADALTLAEELAKRPEPKYIIVGRLLRGLCLWFLGSATDAQAEFAWLAHYIISSGAIPSDFSWDFRDSQELTDRVGAAFKGLPPIIQVLDRKMGIEDFRHAWSGIETPT